MGWRASTIPGSILSPMGPWMRSRKNTTSSRLAAFTPPPETRFAKINPSLHGAFRLRETLKVCAEKPPPNRKLHETSEQWRTPRASVASPDCCQWDADNKKKKKSTQRTQNHRGSKSELKLELSKPDLQLLPPILAVPGNL